MGRSARSLSWIGAGLAGGAGLLQVALLLYVFIGRLTYPLDLEWEEGGMLSHALRVLEGEPLYAPPSADFIAYLYTPFYPVLLAGLGAVFGLSYTLGRAVSSLAFMLAVALVFVAVRRQSGPGGRGVLWGLGAAGLIASSFRDTMAWYDLVRNDSLFIALVMGGLFLLLYHHQRWRPLIAAGILLGLAFLTKQTGAIFIVLAGAALFFLRARRLPVLVLVVGAVAGGSVLLVNHLSDGWMWRYIYEFHQGHDFYWDRAFEDTPLILAKASPVSAALLGLWLIGAVVVLARRRRIEPLERQGIYWFGVALAGVLVSCVGYGTQWAELNAFIPALLFAGMFAGLAAVDLQRWVGGDRRPLLAGLVALVVGGAIAVQLVDQRYWPKRYLPRRGQRAVARAFLERLRAIDGPLLVPYHPYYPALVGKRPSYHQMGINDITRAGQPFPQDINRRIVEQQYAAVLFDRVPDWRYGAVLRHYKLGHYFPAHASPLVVTGYRVRPHYLLVRKQAEPPPPGGRRVFGFEDGTYDGWQASGRAFGGRPVGGDSSNQALAGPYEGRYLASSYVGGDSSTGSLRSPPFVVDRPVLTYRVGGGRRPAEIEVRLLVDGQVVHRGTGSGNHVMQQRRVDVSAYRGKAMVVELVDNARGGWGHLLFDDLTLRSR